MSYQPLLKIGCAYIRVSDERQDEYSPDSQLKKVREYAAKEGYTIPDEYVFYDDGISGKSTKKRDDFNRMIAMAKEKDKPFDAIFVWKFSRFARNQEESIVYKNLLAKKGVSVISVSEPIPEGAFGSLIERIIEWMDQYYLINLSSEVKRGMTEKVSRGEPICPPAFGYDIKDKKYYPNEEQAPIVKEIFTRYANGEGMRKIAIELGIRGIRTKQGKSPENRWIEFILNNPLYIGKIRWSTNGVKAVSKRDYTNENIMTVDGHHEPIITNELWEKVQTRLENEKKLYSKYSRREQPIQYMLKGLVRCSDCGGTLALASVKSGKSQAFTMQCCNYSRGRCLKSHSVTMPKIEKSVIDGLKEAIKNESFTMVPQDQEVIQTITDYDKLIAKEEKRLERAQQAYLAEIDTIEQYAVNKKAIEKKIAEIKKLKASESTSKATNTPQLKNKVTKVVKMLSDAKSSPESKNQALRTIVDKIVYDKATENISIYFHA